ncbi:MAG TPA: TonB family protein [Gammaproteobacteria bacterium]
MPVARLPLAFGSGVLLSLAMFSVLWGLVDERIDVGAIVEPRKIEFTRQIVELPPPESRREPRIEREPPPAVPGLPNVSAGPGGVDNPIPFSAPTFAPSGLRDPGLGSFGTDRDVIPLVRVNPDYPPAAVRRNIEGWVKVQFTITAAGTVRDALVVEADPEGVFDGAALAAISRWRYNPKIEGGVPVERVGLQTIIRFDLE